MPRYKFTAGGWSWSKRKSDELWTEDRTKDSDTMAASMVNITEDATYLLKKRMVSRKKVMGEEGTGDPELEVAEQQEVKQHEDEEAINVPCNKLEEVDLAEWTIVDGWRRGRRRGWQSNSTRSRFWLVS